MSETPSTSPSPTRKSERTRESIRAAALTSFRERGYDDTTVRLIAQEAGVSLGNAYYYFPSKNHLVQELYLTVMTEHAAAARTAMADETDLIARLRHVYATGLDALEPFHDHASGFLSAAVSPKSPVSPLGEESVPARQISIDLFDEAISGSRAALPEELRSALPRTLQLGYLLLALYWVYDSSDGQERTRRLLERGLGLLGMALPLAKTPVLGKPIRELLALIEEVGA